MADALGPCQPQEGCEPEQCACEPQPNTQLLLGDRTPDVVDTCPTCEPILSPGSRTNHCQQWRLKQGQPASEDGNARQLAQLGPGDVSYVLHSNAEYRPCDVERGGRRVCDLLQGGMRVQSAQDCAQLCTCMRDLPGVYCNAAAWVWSPGGLRAQAGNCFPKFIEGAPQLRGKTAPGLGERS